jgi:hypothetical protein
MHAVTIAASLIHTRKMILIPTALPAMIRATSMGPRRRLACLAAAAPHRAATTAAAAAARAAAAATAGTLLPLLPLSVRHMSQAPAPFTKRL